MTDFEKVLMNRDGMTEEEAREELEIARENFYEAIAEGWGEEFLEEEYGLEPDYIFDLL